MVTGVPALLVLPILFWLAAGGLFEKKGWILFVNTNWMECINI